MEHILTTPYGEIRFLTGFPVRFTSRGWPDKRYRAAKSVTKQMEAAIELQAQGWLNG